MRKLFVLLALGIFAAGLLTTTGSAAGASSHAKPCGSQPGKMGRFAGVVHAQSISGPACDPTSPLGASPPLVWHGGPVMPGPTVITPIYWEPSGYYNAGDYRNIINRYLADVAAASGSNNNVYSTATEYYGSNGPISYSIVAGTPIRDHNPFPNGRGCTVGKLDASGIYADGSGYTACLDDAQITAEIQRVITARGLPSDYHHEYVMLTPKHVESCFYSGNTTNNKNVCTINHYPSAGYCAYHTMFGPNYPVSGTVYANMPYPIYHSPVGFTCGTDAGGHGTIESPNFNGSASSMDADVEISPLSHEIMESITDPNTSNGWFDGIGNENGDDCAYVYGNGTWTDMLGGSPGTFYNQIINGDHYITQEEFSNADWINSNHTGGCVRGETYVTPAH
ncbi:MAG TPA: hypothetical protein VE984_09615 [Gaiellaceae bacterium]|nr:hypothetical protein [Gaiellaceae bacterium]